VAETTSETKVRDSISVDLKDNTGKVVSEGKYETGDKISVDTTKDGKVVSKGTYENYYTGGSSSSSSSKNNTPNVSESENLAKIKGGLNQEAYNQVLINADVEASRKGQKVILDYNVGVGFYTIGTGEKYDKPTNKLTSEQIGNKNKLSKEEILNYSNNNQNWNYQKPNEDNSLLSQMGIKTKDKNQAKETRPQTETELKTTPSFLNSYNATPKPKKSDVFYENEKYKVGGGVIDVIEVKDNKMYYNEKNITPIGSLLDIKERGTYEKQDKIEVNKKGNVLINDIWVGKEDKTYSDSYFMNEKTGKKVGKHEDVQRLDYAFERLVESGRISDREKALPYHNFISDSVLWTKNYYEGTKKIQEDFISPLISLGWEYNPVGITIKSVNYLDNVLTKDNKKEGLFDNWEYAYNKVGEKLGDYGGGAYKTIADILPKSAELYVRSAYEGALSQEFLGGKLTRTQQDKTSVNVPLVNVKFDLPKEMVDYTFLTTELSLNALAIGGGAYSGIKSATTSITTSGNIANAYIVASGLGAGIGGVAEGLTFLNKPSDYNFDEGLSRIAYTSGSMAGYVGVAHLSAIASYSTTKAVMNAPAYLKSALFTTSIENVPIQTKTNIGGKLTSYNAYMEISRSKEILGVKIPLSDSYTYAGSMKYVKSPNSLFSKFIWSGEVGTAYKNQNIKGISFQTPTEKGKSDFITLTKRTDSGLNDIFVSKGTSEKVGKVYKETGDVYNIYRNVGETSKVVKISSGGSSQKGLITKDLNLNNYKIIDTKKMDSYSYDYAYTSKSVADSFKTNLNVKTSVPSTNLKGGDLKVDLNSLVKTSNEGSLVNIQSGLIQNPKNLKLSDLNTKIVPLSDTNRMLNYIYNRGVKKTENNLPKITDNGIIKIDNLPIKPTPNPPKIINDEIPPPPSDTNIYNIDNRKIETPYNFNFEVPKFDFVIPPVVLPIGARLGGGGGGGYGRNKKDNYSLKLFTLQESLNLGKTSAKLPSTSKTKKESEKYVGNFARKSKSLSEIIMKGGKRK